MVFTKATIAVAKLEGKGFFCYILIARHYFGDQPARFQNSYDAEVASVESGGTIVHSPVAFSYRNGNHIEKLIKVRDHGRVLAELSMEHSKGIKDFPFA
ncbi:hypothetical protein [Sphingobacterium bambusae]|uniref:Uncharacterized protein n=1 Tax=Sphingobacterium bambusae TaxID=662858 RepID=A0ABW6BFR6_9SPHI|nr:hypothetical protein [Sphingobacterium bambusae]WPL47475.1 hypothetical protein SCB77_16095 [Sphingobacterium bambusae]